MIAYRLELHNGDSIDIAFKEGQTCSLTINRKSKYSFAYGDSKLKVCWEIDIANSETADLKARILSVTPIDFDETAFKSVNKGDDALVDGQNNCCTFNGEEYCIFEGCVQAPCGTICA